MNHASTVAVAEALARGIELVGIAVMILGGLGAAARIVARTEPRTPFAASYHELRANSEISGRSPWKRAGGGVEAREASRVAGQGTLAPSTISPAAPR